MISYLPMDLVEEILSKLPLRSIRAVRLTCKKWNALSKNQSFTKVHLGKAAAAIREGESEMIVMLRDYNLYLMSVVNGIDVDPYKEDKGKLTCLNGTEQVKIVDVFHCEGLLLCILKDTLKLVVWNPYLGQTRWVEPRYAYVKRGRDWYGHYEYSYALGYENKKNKSCRSYKILRFIDDYLGGQRIMWYEIYDFDSDLWTTLDVTPHWRMEFRNRGLSFKGNTYWCGYTHIFFFDFTKERFGQPLDLSFRANYEEDSYDTVRLSCFREEKFAAFVQWNEDRIEIWITNKIEDEKMSWSKFLEVGWGPAVIIPIYYCDFFIDEEQKVAMVFNKDRYNSMSLKRDTINIIGEAGYFRKVDLGKPSLNKWSPPIVCSYAPSLVQIKEPVDGERKKESDLEKYLFDRKKSFFSQLQS